MKKLILFFDCGDTIIDESTEYRPDGSLDKSYVVMCAEAIPGAKETITALHKRGYRMAIVADGLAESFKNVLGQNGLYDCFETLIYSETIKFCKPDARMFKAAIGAMDLSEKDIYRIAMVGNNLSRDIKGAIEMGITSIFLDWTPRYPKQPADKSEIPDYIIHEPLELLELAEKLESELSEAESNK